MRTREEIQERADEIGKFLDKYLKDNGSDNHMVRTKISEKNALVWVLAEESV